MTCIAIVKFGYLFTLSLTQVSMDLILNLHLILTSNELITLNFATLRAADTCKKLTLTDACNVDRR